MSGKAVREVLGSLAVLAGLAFVGLQIQQSNVQARAATRQAIMDNSLDLSMARALDPDLNRQVNELWRGEADAIDCQVRHSEACAWIYALLRHHENVFFQVSEGVVDETAFRSYGWSGNPIYAASFFPGWWARQATLFHPGFVAALEAEYHIER